MTTTITTHNLGALHAESPINVARDGAGEGVEKGRPAAAGLEFMRGAVERRGASGARIDSARRHMFVVGAGVGCLGAFLAEDAKLF